MIIMEQGAPKMIKRSMEKEEKLKRSSEHRKMKKEQGKSEKGAKGKRMKGAGSKKGNCERSKEHGYLLTEARQLSICIKRKVELNWLALGGSLGITI